MQRRGRGCGHGCGLGRGQHSATFASAVPVAARTDRSDNRCHPGQPPPAARSVPTSCKASSSGLHCGVGATKSAHSGPIAQLDRASDYESEGRAFESLWVRHISLSDQHVMWRPSGWRGFGLQRGCECRCGSGLEPSHRGLRHCRGHGQTALGTPGNHLADEPPTVRRDMELCDPFPPSRAHARGAGTGLRRLGQAAGAVTVSLSAPADRVPPPARPRPRCARSPWGLARSGRRSAARCRAGWW